MNLLILASFSLSVIAYLIVAKHRRSLPPCPWGLPLIGHLHHLIGGVPHKSLHSLSNKLGPIMSINLGLVPAVVISNSQIAKEVFKSHDLNTAVSCRPGLLAGEFIFYSRGIVFTHGDHWSAMRKLCTTELFTERRLQSYLWVRLEELSLVFSTLFQAHASKQAVTMRDVFTTFTFNIMTQILMSKRYFGKDKEVHSAEAKEFKHLIDEIATLTLGFHITEFLPPSLRRIGRWFDWSIPRFRKVRDTQDKFLDQIINEHLATKSSRSCEDFMDILLKEFENDDNREDTVKASVMEMVTGGTDTSAVTSEWALAELLHNSHIMKKAQEETDQVVGKDRMVQEGDFPKLVYLQAILKETLRLHPTVPLLVPRRCTKDSKVGGYHIPNGATVFFNVYAMGRDDHVWENPAVFDPERFMGSPINFKSQDFKLIPFGAGKRLCPGMPLGLKSVQLLLANLIHGFDWSFPNDGTTQSLDDFFNSVSLLKSPLRAIAVPRLSPESYSVL